MSVTDEQPTDASKPRPKPPRRLGLSGKLLLLTIPLVMIAEMLIYVPAIANFRMNRLNDRLAAANTAALVLDAAPLGHGAGFAGAANSRAASAPARWPSRWGSSAGCWPAPICRRRSTMTSTCARMTAWSAIVDSFEIMLETGNQAIRVIGPAPGGAQFIEVVIDEAPLRQAMYRFLAQSAAGLAGDRGADRGAGLSARCIICSCGRCGG